MAILSEGDRRIEPRLAHVTTRRIRDDLWRVTSSPSGVAVGYIARVDALGARVYEARRLRPGGVALLPIGRGWSVDDALACFAGP